MVGFAARRPVSARAHWNKDTPYWYDRPVKSGMFNEYSEDFSLDAPIPDGVQAHRPMCGARLGRARGGAAGASVERACARARARAVARGGVGLRTKTTPRPTRGRARMRYLTPLSIRVVFPVSLRPPHRRKKKCAENPWGCRLRRFCPALRCKHGDSKRANTRPPPQNDSRAAQWMSDALIPTRFAMQFIALACMRRLATMTHDRRRRCTIQARPCNPILHEDQ